MPPKKRGKPAKKAPVPVVDAASASEEDLVPPPPKKRGRPSKKVPDAEVAASNEDDSAPPPAKKARGRPKKVPVTAEVSDEKSPKTLRAKQSTKGKRVAGETLGSDDDSTAPVPTKKANGKQIAKDNNDDGQDVEPDGFQAKAGNLFQKPIKKQHNDAQIARTKHLAIPVDEHCPYTTSHRVYIASDGVIYDAALNQTNIGGNNNKFYRIQILESRSGGDFICWTRWGRVGDRGQNKAISCGGSFDQAFGEYSKKFKEKSGLAWDDRHQPGKAKKYVFIERSYEPDSNSEDEDALPGAGSRRGSKQSVASSEEVKSELELPVQHLMELIFSQKYFKEVMADMAYDLDKLPLGKLSKRTLEQGYQYLKDIALLILNYEDADATTRTTNHQQIIELTNMYLSTIPHNMGRNRPQPIVSEEQLKREIGLLESLSDMKIAEDIMKEAKSGSKSDVHPLDRQYAGLNMSEMTALDPKSTEFLELAEYLNQTRGKTHRFKYEIEDIFRVRREGEFERFENSQYGKMSADRRLLWHGSRSTNFGGILSQGLRIAPPESPVSGYMFGKGVYLADMSSKSANYCNAGSSGGVGLLLLCEAELGKPLLELTNADYNAGDRAKQQGSHSTWGKGLIAPPKWKDAACVHPDLAGTTMPNVSIKPTDSNVPGAYLVYNEYIAYDVDQIRLRYLFRVKMGR